jgi:hypothetical protein
MIMNVIRNCFAATFLLATFILPINVNATIINLDEFTSFQWVFSSVQTQGYDVSTSKPNITSVAILSSNDCTPSCPDNGGFSLWAYAGADIEITSTNGGTFSFSSFDGAETHAFIEALYSKEIEAVGVTALGDIISESFALDWINDGNGPLNDFQNFHTTASFNNLVSLTFSGVGSSQFTIDNINIVSTVPNPSILCLLGIGLIGLIRTVNLGQYGRNKV